MYDDQTELFTQVDEQDNEIGSVLRSGAHADKTIIHRSVGVFILNDKREMLFQKRSSRKDTDPNTWTYSVGGHVTFDDDYLVSAKREVKEELGVDVPLTYLTKSIVHMPHETEFTAFFEGIIDSHITLNFAHDEIADIQWVPVKNISEFIKTHDTIGWTIEGLKIAGYLV